MRKKFSMEGIIIIMYINRLHQNIFFADFTIDQLEHYINSNLIILKEYKKGYTLHLQSTVCTKLDFIISGQLTANSLAENGSILSIFEFAQNSVIGANLLFSDNNLYPLNIYCQKDCVVAHINKEIVIEFLSKNQTFLLEFIKSISNNSVNINRKMITFAQKNLRKCIEDYLKAQSLIQKSNIIKLTVTKKQLADSFGVQRPSLFRELKNMKDANIIDYDSKTITILNIN